MANRKLNSIKFPDIADTYILDADKVNYDGSETYASGSVGEALQNKANIDGSYEGMTAGNAEQLVSNVRVNDKTPYLFRTSGGSVDIGDREYVNGIVGGTVAWNQLYNKTGNASGNGVTFTNVNGTITVTGVATGNNWYTLDTSAFPANHKYLLMGGNSASLDSTAYMYARIGDGVYNRLIGGKTACIVSPLLNVSIQASTGYDGDTNPLSFTPQLFDLTQMFGSTIADYIYSLEQANAGAGVAWFKKLFNKPYYAYNAGELKSVSGLVSHDMTGFNQLDADWRTGSVNGSGTIVANNSAMVNNNLTPVLPNTTYYVKPNSLPFTTANITACHIFDAGGNYLGYKTASVNGATFTTHDNGHFLRLQINSTSEITNYDLSKSEVCLNIAWDNSRNGEYEPYELHSYPLDSTLTLRGIPKLDANNNLYYDGDTYEADGTVTRKYGIVDLGTLTWTKTTTVVEGENRFLSGGIATVVARPSSNGVKANIICSKYEAKTADEVYNATLGVCINALNGNVIIYDHTYTDSTAEQFKTAMSGVYLVYELATPTTETADPYQTPQIVNDFGTEEFVIDSNTFAVPVGHDTEYPVNLVAKLEMAPNSPEGDGDYIVRQTNGTNEYVPLVIEDALPTIPSTAGTYKLTVTVASGSDPVLSWEAE